jgi:hypothetical protein
MFERFHVNFSSFGPVVLKILKIFFQYKYMPKQFGSLLWPHPTPQGHDLNKLVFVLYLKAFM